MAKLRTSAVFTALILALIGLAAGNDEVTEQQAVSEEPIKLIHVLNPGEREYLSPNLIGLQNIAMTFLPLTMNFINVIDAYREVVNGVRYDILVNAIDTKENNTEIICHMIILEKPWLRTQWGDKVREMQSSNCTSVDGENDAGNTNDPDKRNLINDKDNKYTIFNGGSRNELSADDMAKLESQIMSIPMDGSSNIKYPTIPPRIQTTTTTSSTSDVANNEEIMGNPTDENASDDSIAIPTSTTTEKPIELSEDEKNWLDNIFSFGAFSFEQEQIKKEQKLKQQQQQQQSNGNSNSNSNNIDNDNDQLSSIIKKNEESNYIQPSGEFIMQQQPQQQQQQQQEGLQQQQQEQQGLQDTQQQYEVNNFENQFQLPLQMELVFNSDYQQQQQQQQQQQPIDLNYQQVQEQQGF